MLLELVDEAAGKSADLARDVRVQDVPIRWELPVAPALAAALYILAVVRSAEQSCAAVEQRVLQASTGPPPRVLLAEPEVRLA
ncbi:MAG TPA: hypothetical protein VFR76_05685 [Verrucomicrobiae bacterium]|nr:hypothetical protein [Verrucomicrobiae bacterium]